MSTTPSVMADETSMREYTEHAQKAAWSNIGQTERWVSALGGGALAIYGLVRLDWVGGLLALTGGGLTLRGVTGHSYLYQALGLNANKRAPSTVASMPDKQGTRIRRSLLVNRPSEELYNYWHDVEMAPLYMRNVQSVTQLGENLTRWEAKSPVGTTMEWDSEQTLGVPGRLIAWRVTRGTSPQGTAGQVTFTPAGAGRGTIVTLELDFEQLSGSLGTSLGQIVGHLPERDALESLRAFKALMEAGETPSVKGQPQGHGRK